MPPSRPVLFAGTLVHLSIFIQLRSYVSIVNFLSDELLHEDIDLHILLHKI